VARSFFTANEGRFGGAIQAFRARLDVTGSVFRDNRASEPGSALGLSVRAESAASLGRPTFAGAAAGHSGGGAFVSGSSRLDVSDGRFFDNEVSPGVAESLPQSLGAALFSIAPASPPGAGREGDVRGTVADSLFVANAGVEVRDVEPPGGERSALRYDGNSFYSTSFGSTVYSHSQAAPGGLDVAGLNALVVPGSPAIDKSVRPNTRLVSRPRAGDLLIVPSAGATGARSPAFAAFGWSGSQAALDGPGGASDRQLAARNGVVELPGAVPGRYALRVDGEEVAAHALAAPGPSLPPGPFLSVPDLPDFRFKVQVLTGATPIAGSQVPGCIPETLCVSGAVPGRSEVFLRVVGPKPNGYLQPTLVTFSTSTVEVWIERTSTGTVRYYRLEGVGPGADAGLDWLIDREGLRP
jgi:hypothetical protein